MLYFLIHCAISKHYHIIKTMPLIITHTTPECILNLAFSLLYYRYYTSSCLTHLVLQSNPPIYYTDLYCIKHIATVTYTSMHIALYFYTRSSKLITIAPFHIIFIIIIICICYTCISLYSSLFTYYNSTFVTVTITFK